MDSWIGLVALVILAVPIALLVVMVKLAGHTGRIRELEERQQRSISRLWDLEVRLGVIESGRRAPEPTQPIMPPVPAPLPAAPPQPAPVMPPVLPPPLPSPVVIAEPTGPSWGERMPEPVAGPAWKIEQPAPPAPERVLFSAPEPSGPSWSERMSGKMKGEEWEAVVGGSWLNKVGALSLVIGIALFLSYSVTKLGPSGRVAVALGLSFSLLAGGVILERRARYLVFARGLLGGGWAALYSTAYAMYALPAAQVVRDPWLAGVLLTGVAAGMIVHSLRYRSQVVTGLAYFAAFVALAITPVKPFAVVALVPLAASLLFLAYRFSWFPMALFGLVATYGTAISRSTGTSPLVETQCILAAYWVLFEAFDILRSAKRRALTASSQCLFPLNAMFFVGLSAWKWNSAAPDSMYWFFAGAAAAYLAGAILRGAIRRPSSFPETADWLERALSGYPAAITVATALGAVSVLLGFSGFRINLALLAEAELLFLAGLLLGERYLRQLAGGVFGMSLAKLLFMDVPEPGTVIVRHMQVQAWTPIALLTTAVFYLNRILKRPGLVYSYAAFLLSMMVIGFEAKLEYLGLAWLALAVLLFELGFWAKREEFRLQSYWAGVLSWGTLLAVNAVREGAHPWQSLGVAAALTYAVVMQLIPSAWRSREERSPVRDLSTAAGAVFLAIILWWVLPREFLGAGWFALAVLLFELGLWLKLKWFRREGDLLGLSGLGTVVLVNVINGGATPVRNAWALCGAALVAYLWGARLYKAGSSRLEDGERVPRRDLVLLAGTTFLAALLWYVLPAPLIALGWGVLGLLLIELGIWLPLTGLRYQGHVVAALGFGRLFLADFTTIGETAGISHRVLTVIPFILMQYYLWSRLGRARLDQTLRTWYLYAPAILSAVLIRFEAGRTLAVVGWAAIGLVWLALGVRWNNSDLRLQSYALAVVTYARSWTTNFYMPESLEGATARILIGAVVIASFYAGEFLSPRREAWRDETSGPMDLWSRNMFALLATTLLTVLIYREVSGRVLTVACGIEGVLVLIAGFPTRERVLRYCGLLLFTFCILKLFLFDLRELDTPSRIASFLALGLLLLGASWMYTRFRERIRRYL
jgi:hypothetical protein